MFLKNHVVNEGEVSGQCISLGGTKMEEGRTWGSSQDLMSRNFKISNSSLEMEKLSSLKSFQIPSSHKNRTCSGSSTPRLMNAAAIDLEPTNLSHLRVVMYGGQSADTGLTSDEIVVIEGEVTENIGDSKIEVTRYPAFHSHFSEFQVPLNWPDGSHLVQVGDVPEGRTGSALTFVRKVGSSDLLASIGGHSKADHNSDFKHPESIFSLLLVPEMRWFTLANSDNLRRSFQSQTSNSEGDVFIVGGISMKNNQWSVIHPLNEVVKIHINENFTYTEEIITITSEIVELPYYSNFSSSMIDNKIFIFGGFKFPKYDPMKEDLYKFQPPFAKRNKLPKFGDSLYKIDLENQNLSFCSELQGCGGYGSTFVIISREGNPVEAVLHADPKIILYSERVLETPKCDLPEEFGNCSLTIVEKNKDAYDCVLPACGLTIHLKCDKSLKGKAGENQFCPRCRNIDPGTWKPIPGSRRPRWRRN